MNYKEKLWSPVAKTYVENKFKLWSPAANTYVEQVNQNYNICEQYETQQLMWKQLKHKSICDQHENMENKKENIKTTLWNPRRQNICEQHENKLKT